MKRFKSLIFICIVLVMLPACADKPSPLMLAVLDNNASEVRELLEKGADPEDTFSKKSGGHSVITMRYSVLMVAMSNGNEEIINLLLDHGADITRSEGLWGSPLGILFLEKDLPLIKSILVRLEPDQYQPYLGSYLHNLYYQVSAHGITAEAKTGKQEIIAFILDELATNKTITTALSLACSTFFHESSGKKSHEKVIPVLLERWEADTSIPLTSCLIQRTKTAFDAARLIIQKGDIVNLGYDPNKIDSQPDIANASSPITRDRESAIGKRPLHFVVSNTDNEKKIRFLLDHGAKVNVQDVNKRTPLMYLLYQSSNTQALKLLLNNGANPNIRDKLGNNALYWAVANRNTWNSGDPKKNTDFIHRLELLKEKGVDPLNRDHEGKTPLDLPMVFQTNLDFLVLSYVQVFPDSVSNLVTAAPEELRGMDTAMMNKRLYQAAILGKTETLKALLEAGAEADGGKRTYRSPSPIDYARKHGHKHAVEILQEYLTRRKS